MTYMKNARVEPTPAAKYALLVDEVAAISMAIHQPQKNCNNDTGWSAPIRLASTTKDPARRKLTSTPAPTDAKKLRFVDQSISLSFSHSSSQHEQQPQQVRQLQSSKHPLMALADVQPNQAEETKRNYQEKTVKELTPE